MRRRAISVTLDTDNVSWLKGRAGAAGESVSEILDQLVTAARKEGRTGPARSVAGTIELDPSDPMLDGADAIVRELFERAVGRPLVVAEPRTPYRSKRRAPRQSRG